MLLLMISCILQIQTKFTAAFGQDPGTGPYDPDASIPEQVHASIKTSLRNLSTPPDGPTYLDSVVLHAPYDNITDTLAVWDTLKTYVPHTIRSIGISNTTLHVLKLLGGGGKQEGQGGATEPDEDEDFLPAVVQNRFQEIGGYDAELRAHCRRVGIAYQSFWTLSANPALLRGGPVARLVGSVDGLSAPGALYCLVLGLGGTAVLDGTSSGAHMEEDIEAAGRVERWAQTDEGRKVWDVALAEFKAAIGEMD